MMITAEHAPYIARMIAHLNADTLESNTECPECEIEFAGMMFDAEREHGVIRKGDGDFAIIIACEGYFTHGDDGKIKPID